MTLENRGEQGVGIVQSEANPSQFRREHPGMTKAQRWQLNVDNLRRYLVDGPTISAAKYRKRRETLNYLTRKMRRHDVPVLDTPLAPSIFV